MFGQTEQNQDTGENNQQPNKKIKLETPDTLEPNFVSTSQFPYPNFAPTSQPPYPNFAPTSQTFYYNSVSLPSISPIPTGVPVYPPINQSGNFPTIPSPFSYPFGNSSYAAQFPTLPATSAENIHRAPAHTVSASTSVTQTTQTASSHASTPILSYPAPNINNRLTNPRVSPPTGVKYPTVFSFYDPEKKQTQKSFYILKFDSISDRNAFLDTNLLSASLHSKTNENKGMRSLGKAFATNEVSDKTCWYLISDEEAKVTSFSAAIKKDNVKVENNLIFKAAADPKNITSFVNAVAKDPFIDNDFIKLLGIAAENNPSIKSIVEPLKPKNNNNNVDRYAEDLEFVNNNTKIYVLYVKKEKENVTRKFYITRLLQREENFKFLVKPPFDPNEKNKIIGKYFRSRQGGDYGWHIIENEDLKDCPLAKVIREKEGNPNNNNSIFADVSKLSTSELIDLNNRVNARWYDNTCKFYQDDLKSEVGKLVTESRKQDKIAEQQKGASPDVQIISEPVPKIGPQSNAVIPLTRGQTIPTQSFRYPNLGSMPTFHTQQVSRGNANVGLQPNTIPLSDTVSASLQNNSGTSLFNARIPPSQGSNVPPTQPPANQATPTREFYAKQTGIRSTPFKNSRGNLIPPTNQNSSKPSDTTNQNTFGK